MAKSGQLSPREMRDCLLDLSGKQAELRRCLAEYRTGRNDTLHAIGTQANSSGAALKKFIDGTTVLIGGKGLTGLCELLEVPELGREIAELANRVGSRNLGFASHSPEIIRMAFDLIEYFHDNDRSEQYSMAEFASVFGDDAPIVLGVLGGNQEEIAVLGDERTRERLTQVLLDNHLDEHLVAAKGRFAAERQEAAARLQELVDGLKDRTGGVVQLARMIGTPRNSLYEALMARSSLKTIRRLIGEVEKLARMLGSPAPAVSEAGPPADTAAVAAATEAAATEAHAPGPGIPDELAKLGGETTAAGIKHVLTAASFRQIETVALVDLRDLLIAEIERVRMLLNHGSQLGDNTARQILREDKKVAAELRELLTAIRLFTFEDPSQLLELYDSERALDEGETGQTKGKRARS